MSKVRYKMFYLLFFKLYLFLSPSYSKDDTSNNNKVTRKKKNRKKKPQIPTYIPPETVSDCPICKRNMNALLLRFKV